MFKGGFFYGNCDECGVGLFPLDLRHRVLRIPGGLAVFHCVAHLGQLAQSRAAVAGGGFGILLQVWPLAVFCVWTGRAIAIHTIYTAKMEKNKEKTEEKETFRNSQLKTGVFLWM
jgi:hypothetical protein